MASTTTHLMTFAEFENLPDPPSAKYELRHGQICVVAPPKHNHYKVQLRLLRLLMQAAGDAGEVGVEMSFRPRPEYEYWYADVAFLSRKRWDETPGKSNIQGSPELVAEVLSPPNTVQEMRDRRKLCLETGSLEFWTVDADLREVEVMFADSHSITYKSGQCIPLFFGGQLAVDEIFG